MKGVGSRWVIGLIALSWGVGGCDEDDPTAPTVGAVRVTATTTGANPDTDGYTVALDGGAGLALPSTGGEVFFSNVSPGTSSVELTDIAANCSVTGSNPSSVTVTAGDTAAVAFDVACTAVASDLVVTTTTSGDSIDADGYQVVVGTDSTAIGVNDTITFVEVTPGDVDVTLAGVAANCAVTGGNTQTTTIPTGGTGTADFAITCTGPAPTGSGTVVVSTVTSGDSLDADGYTLTLGALSDSIGINDTLTFDSVPVGTSILAIADVASNCSTAAGDSISITLADGDTVSASFTIACTAPTAGVGTVVVTTATTGDSLDADGYTIALGALSDSIAINDTITFDSVPAGTSVVTIAGVAANCMVTGGDSVSVTLAGGDTAQAPFAVTCTAPAGSSPQELIAFTSDRDGNDEVYLLDPDSTTGTNLTNDAGADGQAVWSPDSTRVAFRSDRDGNGEIYVVNADGTGLTNLTNDAGDDSRPTWSGDGTMIAFVTDRDGNSEVYVMNADGTNPTNVTNDSTAADSEPTWSSDGTAIAFVTDRDGNAEIYRIDPDGSNPVNLTNDSTSAETSPAWSPDGTKIAFVSDGDGNAEVYTMNADGSGWANLTNDGSADTAPSWSPDGTRIAFATDRDGNSEIYLMASDGTGAVNLTNNAASDRDPHWGVKR